MSKPKPILYFQSRDVVVPGDVIAQGDVEIETPSYVTKLEDGRVEIPKVLRKYLEPIDSAPKEFITPKKS